MCAVLCFESAVSAMRAFCFVHCDALCVLCRFPRFCAHVCLESRVGNARLFCSLSCVERALYRFTRSHCLPIASHPPCHFCVHWEYRHQFLDGYLSQANAALAGVTGGQ